VLKSGIDSISSFFNEGNDRDYSRSALTVFLKYIFASFKADNYYLDFNVVMGVKVKKVKLSL
jgi:hypothetical protein